MSKAPNGPFFIGITRATLKSGQKNGFPIKKLKKITIAAKNNPKNDQKSRLSHFCHSSLNFEPTHENKKMSESQTKAVNHKNLNLKI